MSINSKIKTKFKNNSKVKQKFIRINIDDKLDTILNKYAIEYPLFSRSDIVKLLLSRVIRQDEEKSLLKIMEGASFIDISDEDEQFDFLRKNSLSK